MKKKIIMAIFFIVVLLLLVFYYLFFSRHKNKIEQIDLTNNEDQLDNVVQETESNTISTKTKPTDNQGYFISENYKTNDIQFQGSSPVVIYGDKDLSLDIYDIDGKILSDPKKKEVNLLIKWKTNKLAISEVEYFPKRGGEHKFYKEKNFGFNHNVVISGLNSSTAYVYKIKCRDSWGKESLSDSRVVYTGKGFTSIFDTISEAFGDMFSWISH